MDVTKYDIYVHKCGACNFAVVGTVPFAFRKLSTLTYLDLKENNLVGMSIGVGVFGCCLVISCVFACLTFRAYGV